MRLRRLAVAAVPLALAACEPRQLTLGARTIVGINAQINPEQTTGSVVIGYDRTFAAIVPRSADPSPAAPGSAPPANAGRDAMAALVCSDLKVEGITIRSYTDSMATGDAAVRFASNLGNNRAAIGDLFSCFRARPTTGGGNGGGGL
jgi:hypothetical protein